ncbi:MAG TPA: selenocysteine-specific translation elongation factor [Thermoleophilaceae bacterium]|nr:selenocysteine-specific translation elongation factor [Thermoleophilaceae bacterium]
MATPARRDQPLTLGTAGHIDHGKTALVDALTGKNTDRLPEERSRGISIELGYAPLALPSGRQLSVVDVPGHERFVRTMVAGASGIDLFLLCVAADDGVMPQTREHMAVLRQLGVRAGVVAITKSDTGEPELAAEEAAELVPGAEVVQVSALRRTGLDELLAALDRAAAAAPSRAERDGPARLHLDRSFTLRGIGTVVTGTLWSGSIGAGESVRVLPRGLSARVRSVQVHDEPVERAAAGQRVALNLVGPGWRELGRGDVVTSGDGDFAPTYLIDAALSLEPGARPLRRGARVHVHHGTRESPARVVPLQGDELRPGAPGYAQLRLEAPLVPLAGDRVVIRQLAPPDTVGGGVVIDAHPRKHGGSPELIERLRALERGEKPPEEAASAEPETSEAAAPEPPPLDEAALRIAALLRSDGERPRTDNELAEEVGLTASEAAERLRRLAVAGQAVRVARNLHFHPDPLSVVVARVIALCERDGSATIASVRDELGTSRKYAQALLEHLDGEKVTRRVGDAHVLRRRA